MDRPPRVVAELGRPETPEETAARKAEASRRHRSNQTVRNLVYALVACLGIVALIILVVVRPDQPIRTPADWSEAARQAQPSVDVPLADPVLPDGWTSNSTRLDTRAEGITTWYIGFISPGPQQEFIGLRQGVGADDTWVANQVDDALPTGAVDVDGTEWTLYDRRDSDDPGNLAFAMTAPAGDSVIVLFGTADDAEFLTLASSVVADISPGSSAP